MTMTREAYEQRKAQLDEATATALEQFESAQKTLMALHKDHLALDAEWASIEARATATPGMRARSLRDPVMVAAAKVLTNAGHTPALVGEGDIRVCRDTGFFLPTRQGREEAVEVWHLVDGSARKQNGVDAWYEQLGIYQEVFKAAGWQIEWQSDVLSIRVIPPADLLKELTNQ